MPQGRPRRKLWLKYEDTIRHDLFTFRVVHCCNWYHVSTLHSETYFRLRFGKLRHRKLKFFRGMCG